LRGERGLHPLELLAAQLALRVALLEDSPRALRAPQKMPVGDPKHQYC